MNIIELRNVSKAFNGLPLFSNVSATFKKGRAYGIVGHNGSGKSVLFKMMCGFIHPDAGEVHIDARYKNKKDDFPEKFGILIDRPGYVANKTAYENLKDLAAINHSIGDQEIYQAMKIVGLDPNLKQKMKNYSLGMKQKTAIAQAFMENQEILILDEPFNALDHDSVQKMRNLFLTFKEEGKTIILTSHNQEDLNLICDEQMRINNATLEPIA